LLLLGPRPVLGSIDNSRFFLLAQEKVEGFVTMNKHKAGCAEDHFSLGEKKWES